MKVADRLPHARHASSHRLPRSATFAVQAQALDPALGSQARSTQDDIASVVAPWRDIAFVAVPCGLMLLGAAVGYLFTLDAPVARERLIGLAVASLLAVATVPALRRLTNASTVLMPVAIAALIGGVWVIAASGPDVFRGTVGSVLQVVFRPIFGAATVTDPIEVTNTRFIVGYNGLADLCLVAIFCVAALIPGMRRPRPALVAVIAVSGILLVGTGARGGLTGLAAGICAIGIFVWPRRLMLLAILAAPLAFLLFAFGILDKGLEFSSTAGRLTYWGDLARLLVEYPLTGVGLGLDTAFRATTAYQVNPDPERIFYAHNTFVQSYLEMGPLGMLGMLAVPLVALGAAIAGRGVGVRAAQRPLLVAGLGIVGGMEAHGLTDQVVTTNLGTLITLLGFGAVIAGLSPAASRLLIRLSRPLLVAGAALAIVVAIAVTVWPAARAQALLDLGSLRLNRALALDTQQPERPAALASADDGLRAALAQDPTHPAVLRELARVQSTQYDDAAALRSITQAAASPRLDAFDMLQIAQVYRDLGFSDDAYAWAARAYSAWGRAPEDAIMQVYAQATLSDTRAQTLATQAEAAMRGRRFAQARDLFTQALTFQPGSAYLTDRVGAADRAVTKYGPGDADATT
jgi:hypothetical protein